MGAQELLNVFTVRTEKRKKSLGALDPTLIDPIHNIAIKSAVMEVREKMQRKEKVESNKKVDLDLGCIF